MSEPWPEADLERVPACPVCGEAGRVLLHDGLTDRLRDTAPGRWSLQRCTSCGSGYLDPRPTPATIARVYGSEYETHTPPADVEAPLGDSAFARLRRRARNGYLNRRWGYAVQPDSPLGWLASALPPLRAETDRAFRHLHLPEPGAPLLAVGCGNGASVVHMAAYGWDAEGHEIDPDARAQARAAGARVPEVPLEELAAERAGHYAAVTLSHVIEHVHEPVAFLATLRRLLRPGGVLWLATPNLGATGHRRYGRDWFALEPPRHLVLFTRGSMARALGAAGFDDVAFHTPWAGAGGLLDASRDLQAGRRPDVLTPGSRVPDLVSLLQPGRAEEMTVTARNGAAR